MTAVLLAWVAASAVGLAVSAFLTVQSWRDIIALYREGDMNGRRWSARSRFIREGMRVTVHWVYLLIGIGALRGTDAGWLTVAGLLYGNVALVVNSLVDARIRSMIYRGRFEMHLPETKIEQQDREIGDERRHLQAEDGA